MALSCGATPDAEHPFAPAASVGDEPPPSTAKEDPTIEQESEPSQQARGRLLVQAKFEGKLVPAHVRMLLSDDYTFDFESGEEVSAFAGTQRLELKLANESLLVDNPTLPVEAFVEPDKLSRVDAVFPWAKVQLRVLVRGSEQPPMPVKLVRDGNVVAEVLSGPPAFLISPGTYEADVQVRGKTVRVKDLVFFESTDQSVPVRAQL